MKNKLLKQFVALLLSLTMIFSTAVFCFATEEESKPLYVALGDSMTTGYGLDGTEYNPRGFMDEKSGSYPVLIASEGGYELKQLGVTAMRPADLRVILEYGSNGINSHVDQYNERIFQDKPEENIREGIAYEEVYTQIAKTLDPEITFNGVMYLHEEYVNDIKEASLITYNLGHNDFCVFLGQRLESILLETTEHADTDTLEDLLVMNGYDTDFLGSYEKVLELFKQNVPGSMMTELMAAAPEKFAKIVDAFAYAYADFCISFDANMQQIIDIKKDDTAVKDYKLIVLPLINPLNDFRITYTYTDNKGAEKTLTADIEKLMDAFFELLRQYQKHSRYSDKYTVADYKNVNIMSLADKIAQDDAYAFDYAEKFLGENGKSTDSAMVSSAAAIIQSCCSCNVLDLNAVLADPADTFVGVLTQYLAFSSGNMDVEFGNLMRALGRLYFTSLYENGTGAHPSEAGHRTIADAAVKAIGIDQFRKDHTISVPVFNFRFDIPKIEIKPIKIAPIIKGVTTSIFKHWSNVLDKIYN